MRSSARRGTDKLLGQNGSPYSSAQVPINIGRALPLSGEPRVALRRVRRRACPGSIVGYLALVVGSGVLGYGAFGPVARYFGIGQRA